MSLKNLIRYFNDVKNINDDFDIISKDFKSLFLENIQSTKNMNSKLIGGKESKKDEKKEDSKKLIKYQNKNLQELTKIGDMITNEIKKSNTKDFQNGDFVNLILKIITEKKINISVTDLNNLVNYIKRNFYINKNVFKNHTLNEIIDTNEVRELLNEINGIKSIYQQNNELVTFSRVSSINWNDIEDLNGIPLCFDNKNMIPSILFTLTMLKTELEKLYLLNDYNKILLNYIHQKIDVNDVILLNLRLSDPDELHTNTKQYKGVYNEILRMEGISIIKNLYINARNGIFHLNDKKYEDIINFTNKTLDNDYVSQISLFKTTMDLVSYKPLIVLDQNKDDMNLHSITHIEIKIKYNRGLSDIKIDSSLLSQICLDPNDNKLYVRYEKPNMQSIGINANIPFDYMSPDLNYCEDQKRLVYVHQRISFSIDRRKYEIAYKDCFLNNNYDNIIINYPDKITHNNSNYYLKAIDCYEMFQTNCLSNCKENNKPVGTVSFIKSKSNQWYEYRPLEGHPLMGPIYRKNRLQTYNNFLIETEYQGRSEEELRNDPMISDIFKENEKDILYGNYKISYMRVTNSYVLNKASKSGLIFHYINESIPDFNNMFNENC